MIAAIVKEHPFEDTYNSFYQKVVRLQLGEDSLLRIQTEYSGIYGLGERFDTLNQKGKCVVNEVIEKFCYQGKVSYLCTPFFFSDTGFGIFIDTKEKVVFHFQTEISCEIPDYADIYLFTGSPEDMVRDYLKLTGEIQLPPCYAFGIWASANHWNTQKDVYKVLQDLKTYRYPASVLVLEAWSDEATFYIWNGAKHEIKKQDEIFICEDFDYQDSTYWSNPKQMIDDLHKEGIRLVLWQIPVFKKQDTGEIPSRQLMADKKYALEHGLIVSNKDKTPYEIPEGNWFAGSYIPDFTNPETKKFWFARRQYLLDMGVDGFKTDGGEFIYSENTAFWDGETGKQKKNQYCQDYTRSYTDFIGNEGTLFSRAGYTGAQSTPIHWAGDHQSTNEELRNVLTAGLSASMSGVFFWSFDIGGFAGPLPTLDVYRRSTQLGCFCPVMQWHSEPDGGQFRELYQGSEGNNERSPWNMATCYNEPNFIEEIRFWHELHMKLVPYIYAMAQKAAAELIPIMRPLIYAYPEDQEVIQIEDEYLFGDALLVAPLLLENQRVREVYLPEGSWEGFFSGLRYEGSRRIQSSELEKMPVYIKKGTRHPLTY